jgi:uncharacterized protein YjbI with pentapeptide repeats
MLTIKELKALEIVKEISQNARKIFFAMLLGCVYSWLTIATTTDVRLLTNTASSPLPIIGTEIPIAWFYIAAPLVLICLYFYFHLYLIKLWESLSELPAIFPDGRRLDERAYPWLLNGLVRRHFELLKKDRPFIAYVQEWLSIFLAWWVVPITMVAFWFRFIPRHDWWGTGFHIGLIVISVAFTLIFLGLCSKIFQGLIKTQLEFKNFWYYNRIYYGFIAFLTFIIFILLSNGAINGIIPESKHISKMKHDRIEEIVPWSFNKFGFDVFANFNEKSVSEKPINYMQIDKSERIESVSGANLDGRNLNYADMTGAFLVKANFRNASLQKAYLGYASLQKANLWLANLQKANLSGANLQEADLGFANLQEADLYRVNLQEANLSGAHLQKALLWYTNLQKTDLGGADLQEAFFLNADLTGAKNLTIEKLSEVTTLYLTLLDFELIEKVIEICPNLILDEAKAKFEIIIGE